MIHEWSLEKEFPAIETGHVLARANKCPRGMDRVDSVFCFCRGGTETQVREWPNAAERDASLMLGLALSATIAEVGANVEVRHPMWARVSQAISRRVE